MKQYISYNCKSLLTELQFCKQHLNCLITTILMMILATNVYDAMVIFLENTKKLNTFAASV